MKAKDSWPSPDKHVTSTEALDLITVPVVLLLSEIAGCTEQVLESNSFLAPGVMYKSLSIWAKAMSNPGRYDAQGSNSSMTHESLTPSGSSGTNKKMPSFKIDPFMGDTMSGDVFIWNVRNVFKSNAVTLFLSDNEYCQQNASWYGAFASCCIRTLIVESPILSSLATILGVFCCFGRR